MKFDWFPGSKLAQGATHNFGVLVGVGHLREITYLDLK